MPAPLARRAARGAGHAPLAPEVHLETLPAGLVTEAFDRRVGSASSVGSSAGEWVAAAAEAVATARQLARR